MEYTKNIMKDPKFTIGDFTYGKIHIAGLHLLDKLTIGKFCSIGTGVSILVKGYHHNPEAITTYPFGDHRVPGWPNHEVPTKHQYVTIGNDVWIGNNVTIFNNVTIGTGAIIGTNALVTRDVPPYALVGGVPAEVKKMRFSDEDIEALLKSEWWNWSKEKIARCIPILYGSDVQAFVNAK